MITVVVQETRHVVEVGNPNTVVVAEPQVSVVEIPTQITVVIPQIITNVVEVEPGVPNPKLIFKTADETNTTTSFTNDDELHFEVDEGSTYVGRLTLYTIQTSDDTNGARVKWDIPTDVVMEWTPRATTELDDATSPITVEPPGGNMLARYDCSFLIDATLNGGTVTYQFRLTDDATTGGVTVKAGSFIELFKVS